MGEKTLFFETLQGEKPSSTIFFFHFAAWIRLGLWRRNPLMFGGLVVTGGVGSVMLVTGAS